MASFVLSKYGKDKLVYEGYIYQQQHYSTVPEGTTYWVCEKYKSNIGCPGRARMKNEVVEVYSDNQDHAPLAAQVQTERVRNWIYFD